MKKTIKPELDIENMATKSEIVKMLMSEKDSKINFEISVQEGQSTASLTVITPTAKVSRQWILATTDKFALKLVALLDAQESLSTEIKNALDAVSEDSMNTMEFVRSEWGLR